MRIKMCFFLKIIQIRNVTRLCLILVLGICASCGQVSVPVGGELSSTPPLATSPSDEPERIADPKTGILAPLQAYTDETGHVVNTTTYSGMSN